jgi:hypothetical membrane protein
VDSVTCFWRGCRLKTGNALWLRLSAACGVLSPVVAFTCISLAINSAAEFSWAEDALSDLGVMSGITAPIFNFGLIVSGLLGFVFALGVFAYLGESVVSRAGAFVLVLAMAALTAIGVFSENVRPVHYLVSVAFFVFLPISMLIFTGAFWLREQVRMATFTLVATFAAAAPWVLLLLVQYVSGVAVPEAASGLVAAVWAVVVAYNMFKASSR